MSQSTRKVWLTFEGGCQDQPVIWKLSQEFPDVIFDIRQASIGKAIGIMALQFTGEDDRLSQAIEFIISHGVKVDPVEGGSLVEG
ncbi:MAG: NIL domain-containing protein [Phycisphaeraceae bacterium]|nr:NIL domain-containing protein [Phycisphaeraceae bacterium]